MKSPLQYNPKSKIIEKGYINLYSKLAPKEQRQIKYKTLYKQEHPSWDESMVFLSNWLAKWTGNRDDLIILDAGCGNGNYLIDENRIRLQWAIGIDASQEAVQKNICLDEIKICNLEQLPFADATFDVVTSLWVMEHLENPQKVLTEIYRVLKKGGIFMFATPNINFLPLKVINLLKSNALNRMLNKLLYDREEHDIFATCYKANTLKNIRAVTQGLFREEILKLNYDPSYTSFNRITFELSNTTYALFSKWHLDWITAHIVGVLAKR